MPTTREPFFGLGDSAKSYLASMQKRVNCFLQKLPDASEEGSFLMTDTPGLDEFLPGTPLDFGASPVRGWHVIGDMLFVVAGNKLFRVSNAGTTQIIGTLATSAGYVSMANNGKWPNNQLAVVDGVNVYAYTTAVGASMITIPALAFPNPQTVTTVDGYFLFTFKDTGRWMISGINDLSIETMNALNYANAEEYPDPLQRIDNLKGLAVLLGTRSIEFWSNTGAQDFPFAKNIGTTVEAGLGARFSVAKFTGKSGSGAETTESLIFLATDRLGEYYIAELSTAGLRRISTPAIEAEINSLSLKTDATAYSFITASTPIYVINFPVSNKTLMYDGNTGLWSYLEDYQANRHRGQFGIQFFNRTLVSDYAHGYVYRLNQHRHTDIHSTLNVVAKPMEIISRHHRTYLPVSIANIEIICEPSNIVKTGQLMLQASSDGGATYGPVYQHSMGASGESHHVCGFRNLGYGRDWVFRMRITDDVRRNLIGMWLTTR